jgi:hypothetical protein
VIIGFNKSSSGFKEKVGINGVTIGNTKLPDLKELSREMRQARETRKE